MTADEFSTRLSRECALKPGSHVLVALSGGADSVALLCFFLEIAGEYPLKISCAHVEHGIRASASLDDCAFVHTLCEKKGIPLYTAHVDAPAYSRLHGCGMEDAARRLRYDFLYRTAQEIGAVNSHFTNAHGLHNKEHYTTAYDMALITRWALGIDGFRDLFGATYYSVPPTNKQPIQRNIGTHHMMLVTSKYFYEGTTGGKLGWTPEAHHTMVTLAERDGLELICVVMDSRTQYEKFKDATKLLDYCFENFTVSEIKLNQYADVPIAVTDEDGEVMAEVTIPEQKFFVVHSPKTAKADIKTKLLAPISYRYNEKIDPQATFVDENGNELLTVELEWDYEKVEPVVQAVAVEKEQAHRASFTANWIWGVIAVPLIIYGILLIIRHHNLKLRELRRQQRANSTTNDFDRQINQSINMVNRSHHLENRKASSQSNAKSSSIRGREGYRK